MKASETKSTTAQSHQQQSQEPFFDKEGKGGFFSEPTQEKAFINGNSNNGNNSNFFSPSTIQPKLTIGQPNDKYEREADSVAEKVVHQLHNQEPTSVKNSETSKSSEKAVAPVQRKCDKCGKEEKIDKKESENDVMKGGESVQRKPIFESNENGVDTNIQTKLINSPVVQFKCAECAQEEELEKKEEEGSKNPEEIATKPIFESDAEPVKENSTLQTKSENQSTTLPGIQKRLDSSKGNGQSLASNTNDSMSNAFGADFSGVRVHTDSESVQMNKELGAQAFTHGNDIYFNEGKYDTSSSTGNKLLAHELTHTVQQGSSVQLKEEDQIQRKNNLNIIQKAADCEVDEEESGSEEQAAEAESAPDLGHCIVSNPPPDEPPEGTAEPEEPRSAEVGAAAEAPVDERQSNAPPPDENAPEREEAIQEELQGEETPQGPCGSREMGEGGEGGGTGGGSGEVSGTAAPPVEGGGSAGGEQGSETEGQAQEANSEGAESGGNASQNEFSTLFTQADAQQKENTLNPQGFGENASPDILAERDKASSVSQGSFSALESSQATIASLSSGNVEYLPPPEKKGNEEANKTAKQNHGNSSSIATSFLNNAANRLISFIDKGKATALSLQAGTLQKKTAIRNAIQAKREQTTAVYQQLKSSARARANAAIQQIEVRHLSSIAATNIKALMAQMQVTQTYMAKTEELELVRTSQLERLDQVYETAYNNLIDIGSRMGTQAVTRAGEHEAAYRSAENEPDAEKKKLVTKRKADGFWDGYLTLNRYEARADAAKEVGEQYQEGFVDEAQAQADNMMCGKPQDIEMTNTIAEQGLESLGCARDNAFDAIESQRQAALMQAKYTKQQLIETIQSSLAASINQFETQEAGQLQMLNDYGIRQEMAIDRDTESAIGNVLNGLNDASSKILDYLFQFQSSVQSSQAPAPDELNAQLDIENAQLDGSFQAAEAAFDQSMSVAGSSLGEGQMQALDALQQLYNQGITDGHFLGNTFDSTIANLYSNALSAYSQLDANFDQVIQAEIEGGNSVLTAIITGVTGLYTQISSNLETQFQASAEQTEQGMQETLNNNLDNKVCAQAEKAAADVQPWWKGVLKVLVIILVIVVVALIIGPAVIGAVGAMATAMAGSLGAGAALAGTIGAWVGPIIGGAIVGALSGAVIQVSNNLIDMAGGEFSWEKLGEGVWGAIIAGAIGGAMGGLGGQFAQVIMGRAGAVGLSAGWKFAANFGIDAAFDVVGGILGDLAAGNPITWESIAMGLAIGGAVQLSMGGVSGLARRSAAANADVPGSSSRLGRAAEWTQNFQGRMMGAGENFGARAGAFGKNAPSVDATSQALSGARARIEKGEAFPTRGGEEPEGWRGGRGIDSDTSSRAETDESIKTGDENPEVNPKDFEEGVVDQIETPDGRILRLLDNGTIMKCASPCHIFSLEVEVMARFVDNIDPVGGHGAKLRSWMADLEAIPNVRQRLVKADEFMEALTRIRYVEMMEGVVPDDMLNRLVNQSFSGSGSIDDFIVASRAFQSSDLSPELSYSNEFLARNKSTGEIEVVNRADLEGEPRISEITKLRGSNDQYEVLGPRTMFEGKNSLLQDVISNFSRSTDLRQNVTRQVDPGDLVKADPFEFGGTRGGHADQKHNASNRNMANILNNPDQVYTGFSKAYRNVDVYYKDGTIVVTEMGNKTQVITSYRSNITRLETDPNLAEITFFR